MGASLRHIMLNAGRLESRPEGSRICSRYIPGVAQSCPQVLKVTTGVLQGMAIKTGKETVSPIILMDYI